MVDGWMEILLFSSPYGCARAWRNFPTARPRGTDCPRDGMSFGVHGIKCHGIDRRRRGVANGEA